MQSADIDRIHELVDLSFTRRETHPSLKNMVLAAASAALFHQTPDDYFEKCHGAALSIFMLLRSLRIRSRICGGTVSWLFGGVDASGNSWQSRYGFWRPNPALPSPHAWVLTEFGELVDLTTAFFHHVMKAQLTDARSHDVIPMIWMPAEQLTALPLLQYSSTMSYSSVDLDQCDDLAQRTVSQALFEFWAVSMSAVAGAVPAMVGTDLSKNECPSLLDSAASIHELNSRSSWVARNSCVANIAAAPELDLQSSRLRNNSAPISSDLT